MVFTRSKSKQITVLNALSHMLAIVRDNKYSTRKEEYFLTSNQINYQNYLENVRHNQAVESETGRHNVSTETLGFATLGETQRHNVVGESETYRHNVQGENISWYSASENARHNRTSEAQNASSLAESMRHNVASEDTARYSAEAQKATNWYAATEQARHNVRSENVTEAGNEMNFGGGVLGDIMKTATSIYNYGRRKAK